MNVELYRTRCSFEILPQLSVLRCASEKLGIVAWTIHFAIWLFCLEINWETKLKA